ncbi:hypothetical protein [Bradyrhizobium zhanjiangense]|uniref:Uncharacterized protein n=1 Tax=Bradyrhizobium zhanjiangense TaxID=1325107 RepID=A0ABY0DA53_9BRAD|nr:hypothetical protein [Bradyrhizobium zhanjiangense]RXG85646.1 hypothetical protein EAS62_38495 [Bradyrhizobium zhanjiangense]
MLENVTKYWPFITLCALAVVSVFNMGYFTLIGYHFIGVMDLSNVVYPVGLVLCLAIPALAFFPLDLVEQVRQAAKQPDAMTKFTRLGKVILGLVMVFFAVGLFITDRFLSVMTLFAICFSFATLMGTIGAYILWQHKKSWTVLGTPIGAALLTTLWIGATFAQHETLYSKQIYRFQTKDTEYLEARIVRASSSGFIISHDKKYIFVPSGEVKQILQINSSF